MPLICFLDFDGVAHPAPCFQDNLFCRLSLIEGVLRQYPHISIVITSEWRKKHGLDEMATMFSPDIAIRVIGVTPVFPSNPDSGDFVRQLEIESWMRANRPKGGNWIAVDDRPALFSPDCETLLRIDPATGFTQKDAIAFRAMIRDLRDGFIEATRSDAQRG